jgi:hypothetical protein
MHATRFQSLDDNLYLDLKREHFAGIDAKQGYYQIQNITIKTSMNLLLLFSLWLSLRDIWSNAVLHSINDQKREDIYSPGLSE